jgi:hypothetical protein
MAGKSGKMCRTCALILILATFSACGRSSRSSDTPPVGTPITVSFSAAQPPSVVAEQIGSGAWATAALQGGALHLTLPPGTTRYAVAYVCPIVGTNNEFVIEATTQDSNAYTVSCQAIPPLGNAGAAWMRLQSPVLRQ